MRVITLAFTVVLLLGSMVCSKPPSFEQERSLVAAYLRDFNRIDNDLNLTVSSIPSPFGFGVPTAAQLLQFNNALGQLITAAEGAIRRQNEIKAPDMEDVRSHLQSSKVLLQAQIDGMQTLRRAISSGNATAVANAWNSLNTSFSQASALNRSTESLMLKYNITDVEVDYRFRGK